MTVPSAPLGRGVCAPRGSIAGEPQSGRRLGLVGRHTRPVGYAARGGTAGTRLGVGTCGAFPAVVARPPLSLFPFLDSTPSIRHPRTAPPWDQRARHPRAPCIGDCEGVDKFKKAPTRGWNRGHRFANRVQPLMHENPGHHFEMRKGSKMRPFPRGFGGVCLPPTQQDIMISRCNREMLGQ